jgi:hypothetical protein
MWIMSMGRVWLSVLVFGVALGVVAAGARADDKKDAKSATGTWKSSFTTNDGQEIVTTYKLKQEGEKLTGTVTSSRDNKATKIENGKVKDGQVSFEVTRERGDQKFTLKYKGELKGDTIEGKVEFSAGGNSREFDWKAKRQDTDK